MEVHNVQVMAAFDQAPLARSTRREMKLRLQKLARLILSASSPEDACCNPQEGIPVLSKLYSNEATRKSHIVAAVAAFKHCPSLARSAPQAHGQWLAALANINGIPKLEEQCEEWQVLYQRACLLEPLTLEGLLCTLVTELPPQRAPEIASMHVVSSRHNARRNFVLMSGNMPQMVAFTDRCNAHI